MSILEKIGGTSWSSSSALYCSRTAAVSPGLRSKRTAQCYLLVQDLADVNVQVVLVVPVRVLLFHPLLLRGARMVDELEVCQPAETVHAGDLAHNFRLYLWLLLVLSRALASTALPCPCTSPHSGSDLEDERGGGRKVAEDGMADRHTPNQYQLSHGTASADSGDDLRGSCGRKRRGSMVPVVASAFERPSSPPKESSAAS
eukprot:2226406-Rhodomonas_salina.4